MKCFVITKKQIMLSLCLIVAVTVVIGGSVGAYATAKRILTENMAKLHFIADYLVGHETMDADQFKAVMDEGATAADLLNNASEEKLAEIFKFYGELNCSRKLASAVVKRRATKPFRRVNDLIEVAKPFKPVHH